MPIPVDIDDLSTNPALNSPSGSDPPTEGDNHIRALASILRQEHEDTTDIFDQLASQGTASMGAGMVGWSASIAYTTGVGKKLLQSIHVEDYGAVGDGTTDDEVAVLAAITAGVARGLTVVFDGAKNYAIDAASWSIAAGAKLRTNGATIKCMTTTTGNTVWLTVGDNCVIDDLNVSVPTGVRRDRCILIDGDDARIGRIKLHSVDQQANSEAADGGVQITGLRPYVGLVDIKNYDRALIVYSTTDATIMRVVAENYVRGLYGYDNRNLNVRSGRVHTASPNAAADPGHNGVLLGCTATDAQRDVFFYNFVVENAGEHGFRIGGSEQQKGLHFINCTSRGVGGCGIKVLGTDSGTPTSRNKDIVIDNFTAEDCGMDSSLAGLNRAGVLLKFCDDVVVTGLKVREGAESISAGFGIVLDAVTNIEIVAPICLNAQFDGIIVYAVEGDIDLVNIRGGLSSGNDRNGLDLTAGVGMTMRRVFVDGVNLDSNAGLGFDVDVNGTMNACLIRGKSNNNTSGMGGSNSANVTLQMSTNSTEIAATPLSGITARNGSWVDDGTNFSIRKAGAWTAL